MERYQSATGQLMNKSKCRVFFGNFTDQRKTKVLEVLDMLQGLCPEKYLGVPLIQGRVTREVASVVLNKIKLKLNSWKGRQLSFQGL
ncbi:hypothetical protein FRX31_015416 [Thalictrum thalictroides]|uniref:Uncharacterized protein n=1 Tax=Thalictrum thalictroides TaxID=46969 RepID=A0A7J6WDP5_THATH|nr:hypothetical protein FRX31_015416 [Thalictrum thalictroides]